MNPYFYLFIRLLSAFFLFSVKMQKIKMELCYNMLRFVKETQTLNGEPNYVIINFSLIFELPVQKLGDIHPNNIELASWLVPVLCDFKATWHREASVSLEYTIKIYLADIIYLLGERPPSIFRLQFRYIYFLLYILLSQNW